MTLAELQAACEDLANECPELLDEEVYMTSDYGDHGHNEQCISIRCLVATLVSDGPHAKAYSQQGLEVHRPDPDVEEPYGDNRPANVRPGLVLGYQREDSYCQTDGSLW